MGRRDRASASPRRPRAFALHLRMPGWARNEPVPSDLYRVPRPAPATRRCSRVNGATRPLAIDKGYAVVSRTWKAGDRVELALPMPVRRIVANERVAANRGRIALQRGPIVYAAEWPDNDGGRVRNLVVDDRQPLASSFRPDLLGGVQVVTGHGDRARARRRGRRDVARAAVHGHSVRGLGQPRPRRDGGLAGPRGVGGAADAVSHARDDEHGHDIGPASRPRAINDGEEPASSDDPTLYFDWWPTKGTTEWVEYALPATRPRLGGPGLLVRRHRAAVRCACPRAGACSTATATAGCPSTTTDAYGVGEGRATTRVRFTPVTTSGLRLEVTMQEKWSAGLQEWRVR